MSPELINALKQAGAKPEKFNPCSGRPDVIFGKATGRVRGIDVWRAMRDCYDITGYWPLLFDGGLRLKLHPTRLERKPAMTIERNPEMLKWIQSLPPDETPWPNTHEPQRCRFFEKVDSIWESDTGPSRIALFKVDHPADVFQLIQYGGWNDVPDDPTIAGTLSLWHARFGAVPAVIGTETMELAVEKPPQTESECMKLAYDHLAFCGDLLQFHSLRKVAIQLLNSREWHFWWD